MKVLHLGLEDDTADSEFSDVPPWALQTAVPSVVCLRLIRALFNDKDFGHGVSMSKVADERCLSPRLQMMTLR